MEYYKEFVEPFVAQIILLSSNTNLKKGLFKNVEVRCVSNYKMQTN